MARQITEKQFQDWIVEYATVRGWKVSHTQKVTMKGKGGRVLNMTPAAKGFPDLVLARHGMIVIFEVKTEKTSPTDEQRAWLSAMSDMHIDWSSRDDEPDHVNMTSASGNGLIVGLVRPRHRDWIVETLT